MRTVLLIATATLLAGCSVFGVRSGYEQPPYTVADTLDDRIEIRQYGPRLAAETPLPSGDEDGRDDAFRVLFAYITGANQGEADVAMTAPVQVGASEEIAMTSPVQTASSDKGEVMRFFLPASYTAASAPRPADPRVDIVEVPQATLAVLRFSGTWDPQTFETRETELLALLESSPWRAVGPASTLFYDPPWTLPPFRRNEVTVPVVQRPPA